MKNQFVSRFVKSAVVICLATFSIGALASSEQPKSEEILSEETSPTEMREQLMSEEVEVIEVTGKVPLLYYKRQAELAELDFYDLFNTSATEKKFKVKCRKEARTGSRIKKTVCYPQYVLDKMAQETQNALSTGGRYPSLDDIEFLVKKEKEESLKYVEQIVASNPKLKAQLVKMNEQKAIYESKKETK
jgi:hypothetical protein